MSFLGYKKKKVFDVPPFAFTPFPLVRLHRHLQTVTPPPTTHTHTLTHTRTHTPLLEPFYTGTRPNWVCDQCDWMSYSVEERAGRTRTVLQHKSAWRPIFNAFTLIIHFNCTHERASLDAKNTSECQTSHRNAHTACFFLLRSVWLIFILIKFLIQWDSGCEAVPKTTQNNFTLRGQWCS